MAAPIDEGRPVFVSRGGVTGGTFTMNNMASASRMHRMHAVNGEEDLSYWYNGASDIHNIGTVETGTPSGAELARNIHILNALSYHDKPITDILFDALFHQAKVGMGTLRMSPTGDVSSVNWFPSSGSSPHYTYVNSPVGTPTLGTFLQSVFALAVEELSLRTLPSNATRMHELIISAWMAMTAGSDTGLSLALAVYQGGGQVSAFSYFDCEVGLTPTKAVQCKIEALDLPKAAWDTAYLHIETRRGAAGGAPNPHWYLYDIEAIGHFEVNDITLLDSAAFASLTTAHYSTYLLDLSQIDGTFRSFVVDILKHAPELMLYVAYNGALTPHRLVSYASVTTPFALTNTILEIAKGPYRYTERTANAVLVKWGVRIPNTSTTTATEDPENPPVDQPANRVREFDPAVIREGLPDYRTLERPFIRSAALAKTLAKSHLNLWSEDADALDLVCSWAAIEVEQGDVVTITDEELGYSARRFTVVSKSIDLDEDHVLLTVYDVEYTL